jgi:hypothetical protein
VSKWCLDALLSTPLVLRLIRGLSSAVGCPSRSEHVVWFTWSALGCRLDTIRVVGAVINKARVKLGWSNAYIVVSDR